ncbi:MAG: HlyC/CorC family transporter, partial [Acidobacteria bacterium]|nr:HlyC/CorC family transporter [Acidobacteriota bacterium]
MTLISVVALVVLIGLLTVVSYADRLYTEMGKFLSRNFQENIEVFEQQIEPRLKVSRERAALTMGVLVQIITAAISLLVGYLAFIAAPLSRAEILQAAVSIIAIIILFNRLVPYVFFT